MVDGSGPDGGADAHKRLETMNGDWEAFVRAGLGRFVDVHIRTAFDGVQLLHFDGEGGANVGDPINAAPDYCLDPRILGITVTYGKDETVSSCLAYREAKSIELVGPEKIDGVLTWHVLVIDKWGSQRHFWIEDAQGFRVRKREQIDENGGGFFQHWVTLSDYVGNAAEQPLPIKIVTTRFERDGREISELTFHQVRGDYGIAVDPKAWTLAGMELPIGTPVNDSRVHRIVGHWDGEGLSPGFSEAKRKAEAAHWSPLRWDMVLLGGVVLAALAAAVMHRQGWLRKEGRGDVA